MVHKTEERIGEEVAISVKIAAIYAALVLSKLQPIKETPKIHGGVYFALRYHSFVFIFVAWSMI